MGEVKNRIQGIGIELEGGWTKPPNDHAIVRDGSLKGILGEWKVDNGNVVGTVVAAGRRNPFLDELAPPKPVKNPLYVGEIPSPVLTADTFEAWITKYFPQHVNESCGLHVHMSFRYKLLYMRLMTPEFTTHIVDGLKLWANEEELVKSHPIWGRLNKKNHDHCAHVYLGDNQVKNVKKDYQSRGKPHSRYTAINYCAEYNRQRGFKETVECRLLPMMETPEQSIRAVKAVLSLTNQFLAKMHDREPRKEAKVALAPPVEVRYISKI